MKKLWLAAALALAAATCGARADDFPTRTMTVIVPFAADRPT